MGCTNSKLRGDSFDGIDASAHHARKTEVTDDSAISYHSTIEDENAPSTPQGHHGRESTTANADPLHFESIDAPISAVGQGTDMLAQPPTASVPKGRNRSKPTSTSTVTPLPSTDTAPATKSPKKLSLYQRYTKARLGVGEPRDPVTGKGQYTGLTKDEVREYVYTTRSAGVYGNGDVLGEGRGEGGGRETLGMDSHAAVGV